MNRKKEEGREYQQDWSQQSRGGVVTIWWWQRQKQQSWEHAIRLRNVPENNIVIVTDYLSGSRQDKTGKHGFRPEMLERELDEVTLYSEKNLKQQQQKKIWTFSTDTEWSRGTSQETSSNAWITPNLLKIKCRGKSKTSKILLSKSMTNLQLS